MDGIDYQLVFFFTVIGLIVVTLGVGFGLGGEIVKTSYNAKVISTFDYSGSTACKYVLDGNTDWGYPCSYKVGDNAKVTENGLGIWSIENREVAK